MFDLPAYRRTPSLTRVVAALAMISSNDYRRHVGTGRVDRRRWLAGGLALGGAYWLYRAGKVFAAEYGEFADQLPWRELEPHDTTPALERVTWTIDGLEQHAYYVPSRNSAAIIYAHGSPGEAANFVPEANALAAEGFGALLLDLPGYGASAGDRRWADRFAATMSAALDCLARRSEIDVQRIGVHGYSMGCHVAARAAATDPRIAALTLVAPFTNLVDQLRAQFKSKIPGMPMVADLAANWWGVPVDELRIEDELPRMAPRPVLVIAGELDTVVPLRMPKALTASHPRATLWIARNTGHVGFADLGAPYFGTLSRFWREHLVPTT